MNQPLEYMRHCARCAAISVTPLTYVQFLLLTDGMEAIIVA